MGAKWLGGAVLNFLYNEVITHIPCHWLRKLFLRAFNKKISRSCVILMHSRLLCFWNITLADRVVINQHVLLDARRYRIEIGSDTDIGPYTRIWTLGHQPNSPTHELYGADVVLGHHVWIASGVTLLPGAHIANGAVVAAGAVVHKPVDNQQIVAGNPAKLIKMRNNPLTYKLTYKPFLE